MRFCNRQHQYFFGIDLHVKTMYVCILDATGQVLVACTATSRRRRGGKGKALSILAHKIGRAAYDMLARGTVFSMEKFLAV